MSLLFLKVQALNRVFHKIIEIGNDGNIGITGFTIGFLVFNKNLIFLYKIYIEGFKKFQQKIKLPPVGFKLTTAATTGLEFQLP